MNELLTYVTSVAEPKAILGLMAGDVETEKFYKKFGFKTRKDAHKGAGMIKEVI